MTKSRNSGEDEPKASKTGRRKKTRKALTSDSDSEHRRSSKNIPKRLPGYLLEDGNKSTSAPHGKISEGQKASSKRHRRAASDSERKGSRKNFTKKVDGYLIKDRKKPASPSHGKSAEERKARDRDESGATPVGYIVSDSIFSNESDPTRKTDNTWIDIPGVVFDVVRGRRFSAKYSWYSTRPNPGRVLLVSSGNDFRTSRKNSVREQLDEDVWIQLRNAVDDWKGAGAEVGIAFLGDWELHGAGFNVEDQELYGKRYATCKEQFLMFAKTLDVPTWDIPTRPFKDLKKFDPWHFAEKEGPSIARKLQSWLIKEAHWPLEKVAPGERNVGRAKKDNPKEAPGQRALAIVTHRTLEEGKRKQHQPANAKLDRSIHEVGDAPPHQPAFARLNRNVLVDAGDGAAAAQDPRAG